MREVVVNVCSHAAKPDFPGLRAADTPHVEALELDEALADPVMLGGGYVGVGFAKARRRFGSGVTIIEFGPQVMVREDVEVGKALGDEGGRPRPEHGGHRPRRSGHRAGRA